MLCCGLSKRGKKPLSSSCQSITLTCCTPNPALKHLWAKLLLSALTGVQVLNQEDEDKQVSWTDGAGVTAAGQRRKSQLGEQMAALGRVVELGAPGVEGQQLAVYQEEGMAHFIPTTLRAGIDVLYHLSLQELDALLTQLRMHQPLHGLGCRRGAGCWALSDPALQS